MIAIGLSCGTPARRTTAPAPKPVANAPSDVGSGRARIAIDAAATAAGDGKLVALPEATTALPAAAVDILAPPQTAAAIARLPALPDVATAAPPAMVRPSSPPPKRTGPVVPIAFQAATGAAVADSPVAQVAKRAPALTPPDIEPSGSVSTEAEIRVKFADAMVPIAAVGTQAQPPATISPAVAGTWRWIDTRVAQFTAEAGRFPHATRFTIKVAAGMKSVGGGVLGADAIGSFETETIRMSELFPRDTLRPDSPIAVAFTQPFDRAELAKFVRVEDDKKRPVAVDVIDMADAQRRWAKHPQLEGDRIPDNLLILAPKAPWSPGRLHVVVLPGAPSLEGPLVTARDEWQQFDVAPPFHLVGLTCDTYNRPPRLRGERCEARDLVTVKFNNPIDGKLFRPEMIQVEGEEIDPRPPDFDSTMRFTPSAGLRPFRVIVKPDIVDQYGQRLEGPMVATGSTNRVKVEPPEPRFEARAGMYVLDPRFAIPQWVIKATIVPSVHVRLYAVQPADFFAYERYEAKKLKQPPGKRVLDQVLPIGTAHGTVARIDLRPALNKTGTGHVIAIAETKGHRQLAWIQVTRLGVVTRMDSEHLDGWVTDLTPGRGLAPVANVKATLVPSTARTDLPVATSDAEGHVELALPLVTLKPEQERKSTALLLATTADDSTFAALGLYERTVRTNSARWYVTDDRFLYRPGEHVYIKGWLRWEHSGPNPVLAHPAAGDAVTYQVTDKSGTQLAAGSTKMTAQGGFDLDLALPETAALGDARIVLTSNEESTTHAFGIRAFRRPTFQVSIDDDVTHGGSLPLIVGEQVEMSVEASYYGGGGLPGAAVEWNAALVAGYYEPPGWASYSFSRPRADNTRHERIEDEQRGILAGTSTASIRYGIAALPEGGPSVLAVTASVQDLDRATIRAKSRQIVVHPSAYYVGLHARAADNEKIEVIVTNIDGSPVAGVPVDVTIANTRVTDDKPVTDSHACHVTSALTPVVCAYKRLKAGDGELSYVAEAQIKDAAGRPNASRYDIPSWTYEDSGNTDTVQIVPDQETYRVGDIAKLQIRSKLLPATAIVTAAREGKAAQWRIPLTHPSTLFELPIEASYISNVHVKIDVWAALPAEHQDKRAPVPHLGEAWVNLYVDTDSARLVVKPRSVRPQLRPGEPATFEVDVQRNGKPVAGAEVALFAVDEGILALSQRPFGDPVRPFFGRVGDGIERFATLGNVDNAGSDLDAQPGVLRVRLDSPEGSYLFGGHGKIRGRTSAVPSVSMGSPSSSLGGGTMRTDFRPTAVWAPRLVTDANGHATTTVTMPDSLTRYRIVALAAADAMYFGKGESSVVAQRALNVRIVAPRFLTQGDRFSLPVVVQNLERTPRTVDVAIRAANLAVTGPAGRRLTLAAGARAEVRFDVATALQGTAAIQAIVTAGDAVDSSQLTLPVYVPASTESFATYGVVGDEPKIERIEVPASIVAEIGGLEAELSSTQMQSLVDSFWYLQRYPYECAEQRSARMLGTAALADIVTAFTGSKLSREQLAAERAEDLRQLTKSQNDDGGFGYFWKLSSDPYVTAQVLRALAAAKETGSLLDNAKASVAREATKNLATLAATTVAQRPDRPALLVLVGTTAAQLVALAAAGEDVRPRALALHKAATTLAVYPIDAKARVLALLGKHTPARLARAALLTELVSATHETAAGATVATSFVEGERLLLGSSTKTNALVLDALLREAPEHALIPKLARTILDAREGGRWHTTQENLIVLEAMRRYFDVFEKDVPNFTGKLWIGTTAYAEKQFAGRSMDRAEAGADWKLLAPGTGHDVAIAKTGAGKLYYRLGITYAAKATPLPALDAGFVVRRSYQAADTPGDVTRAADGTWKIKLGAKVLVVVEAVNTSVRHAVALADPLPAGLEPIDSSLATSDVDASGTRTGDWDAFELRDHRGEVFSMTLREGTHRFVYTVRATTPGTFIAAPSKAEEMYHPETFGRSSSSTVVVE